MIIRNPLLPFAGLLGTLVDPEFGVNVRSQPLHNISKRKLEMRKKKWKIEKMSRKKNRCVKGRTKRNV